MRRLYTPGERIGRRELVGFAVRAFLVHEQERKRRGDGRRVERQQRGPGASLAPEVGRIARLEPCGESQPEGRRTSGRSCPRAASVPALRGNPVMSSAAPVKLRDAENETAHGKTRAARAGK